MEEDSKEITMHLCTHVGVILPAPQNMYPAKGVHRVPWEHGESDTGLIRQCHIP
jgi:hypothetical protein